MRSDKSVAVSLRSTNPRTTVTSVWSLLLARRNATAWPSTCCIRDLVRALTRRRPSLDEANLSHQRVRSIASSLALQITSRYLSCSIFSRPLTDPIAADRTALGKRTASVSKVLRTRSRSLQNAPSPRTLATGNGRLRLLLAPAMWHHGQHFLIDTFISPLHPMPCSPSFISTPCAS